MYSHRSIQVVKNSILLCCVATALLASCGGNSDSKNPEQTQAQAILPADTTQAKEVTAEERVVRELHYSGTVGQKTSYKLVQIDDINQDGQAAQMMTSIYYTKLIKELKKDGIVYMNVLSDSILKKIRYPNR